MRGRGVLSFFAAYALVRAAACTSFSSNAGPSTEEASLDSSTDASALQPGEGDAADATDDRYHDLGIRCGDDQFCPVAPGSICCVDPFDGGMTCRHSSGADGCPAEWPRYSCDDTADCAAVGQGLRCCGSAQFITGGLWGNVFTEMACVPTCPAPRSTLCDPESSFNPCTDIEAGAACVAARGAVSPPGYSICQ
jgi:hypothetical protein